MFARKPCTALLLALLATQPGLPAQAQEYPATGLPDYALTLECMFIEYAEFSRLNQLATDVDDPELATMAREAMGRFSQFSKHAQSLEDKSGQERVNDMIEAGEALVERLRASEAPEFERRARLAGCDELASRFE